MLEWNLQTSEAEIGILLLSMLSLKNSSSLLSKERTAFYAKAEELEIWRGQVRSPNQPAYNPAVTFKYD